MKALVPFLVLPLFVSSLGAQKTKLTDLRQSKFMRIAFSKILRMGNMTSSKISSKRFKTGQLKFKTEPRTPRPHVHTSLPTSFDLAFDTDAGSDPSKADSLDHGDSQS